MQSKHLKQELQKQIEDAQRQLQELKVKQKRGSAQVQRLTQQLREQLEFNEQVISQHVDRDQQPLSASATICSPT